MFVKEKAMKKEKKGGRYPLRVRVMCIVLAALTVIGTASILIYMLFL